MKAIKLASIFAVSAVAAAVSTTTFAAEPIFSGTAGLNYTFGEDRQNVYGSEGEVNIKIDTGLVYIDLDMEANSINGTNDKGEDTKYTDGGFDLDEAYVKLGKVSFGDFDGSLIEEAVGYASIEEEVETDESFGNDLAVRYAVLDNLDVALEAAEGTDTLFLTAAGSVPVGDNGAAINLSGGYGEHDDLTSYAATVGFTAPIGDVVTLGAYYQEGEKSEVDFSNGAIGIDLALTDQVVFSAGYVEQNLESDTDDTGVVETTVNYTVGDIRYYVTYLSYETADDDYGYAGVEASF